MTKKTYYVVQPFESAAKGRSKVLQPFEVPNERAALIRAEGWAKKGGAIAFSRSGDPECGEFDDAVIIGRFGEIPRDFEY
jgi:hypothetical protein